MRPLDSSGASAEDNPDQASDREGSAGNGPRSTGQRSNSATAGSGEVFAEISEGSTRNFLDTLRGENIGGVLLIIGAAVALIWANSPWQDTYAAVRDTTFGIPGIHLELSVGQWAADGLLAIFFFTVGLELKREIVGGELRRLSTAIVPMAAAVGGMAVPALIYLAINLTSSDGAPQGWAVPTATDIAFAVAVLALVGRWLPTALRAFLLTLAVVDDLLAIIIIAVAYSSDLSLWWLVAVAACVLAYVALLRRGITAWYLLLPLGLLAWYFMHASGVHATIAGVILGLATPAAEGFGLSRAKANERAGARSLAEYCEHLWRPVSAGFAVPVFALFAAGVSVEADQIAAAFTDPVAIGVVCGLVLGKPIGIVATTWLVTRTRHARLAPGLGWADIFSMAVLAGIGFTVSLLVAELAFGPTSDHTEHAKMAILAASVAAAVIGAVLLTWRGQVHRARALAEGEPGK